MLHMTFPIMDAGKREKATDEAFAIGQPAKVAFACDFKGKRLAVAKRGILQLGYPQVKVQKSYWQRASIDLRTIISEKHI